jgi:hypothetical protein
MNRVCSNDVRKPSINVLEELQKDSFLDMDMNSPFLPEEIPTFLRALRGTVSETILFEPGYSISDSKYVLLCPTIPVFQE